jgi:hypothetical protein
MAKGFDRLTDLIFEGASDELFDRINAMNDAELEPLAQRIVELLTEKKAYMAPTDTFVCRRCAQPPVGLVSVADLDDGRAAGPPVAEVALCGEPAAEVAAVLGFEGPAAAREDRRRGAASQRVPPIGEACSNGWSRLA